MFAVIFDLEGQLDCTIHATKAEADKEAARLSAKYAVERANYSATVAVQAVDLPPAFAHAPAMLAALQRIANDSSAWGECVNIAADAITSATDQTPTSPALGAAGGTDTASGADLHDFAREWVATYDTENYAGAGGYDGGGFTYDDMQDAFEAGARFIPTAQPADPAGGIECGSFTLHPHSDPCSITIERDDDGARWAVNQGALSRHIAALIDSLPAGEC